ncbi:MAG: MDR family MFS transporter [Xanthobacteraceae bacterium]|jgi:EmrB/QacA subfamily drug resistance transporter
MRTRTAPDRLVTLASAGATTELSAASPATAPIDHSAVRAIVAGIMLAMFLSALEQTIVAPALPAIGRSLGGIDELSWVVTAYLLAVTATTPLFGKLSDIYGRRVVLLWAIGIFIGGSIACALAPTIWTLIFARGLQGIGGGGLLPIAQTIIADLLSPQERPVVQGRTSIMFMSASILGPVLGGFFTDQLHWSLIFWINLPLGAVALVMSERALRQLPRNERPHQLDVIGATLMVGAALSVMLALAWGGTHYPWSSPLILSLLAASAMLWGLFATRLLTAREPFIPLTILRGRVTSTITCAAFFSVGTIIGITIYTPLYCETVLGLSASSSGLALIAFMAGTVVGSLTAARLMVRLTRYMFVPLVAMLFAVIALGVLAVDPVNQSIVRLVFLLFVLGCGVGPMYPMSTIVMQNAVKPHQLGTATGTLNFFRTLGGAIIVAVFGAIVLGSGVDGAGIITLERLAAAHGDLAPAFRWVFIAAMICLAIAFASLLAVEERPLHGPLRRSE